MSFYSEGFLFPQAFVPYAMMTASEVGELLAEWDSANESDHLPTAEPQGEGEEPVFIGNRPTGKTVVVGEECRETIFSENLKPIDLESVR